jgi:TonB-linked SusC/RagA family outer membrane protein
MRKLVAVMKAVFLLLLIFSLSSSAQAQTVSGTVTDADKHTPLSGATVRVVGTTTVTQTSERGTFTIKAANGQTLQITSIGFETKKVVVSGSSVSVSLKTEVAELEEVVVAMDIKRKPRELGYSTQSVKGKEIAETQRDNFLNSLQGRVSGLTITPTNGIAGASSQIVLRGFNSLSLSNQPLFVVDGIIMDNQTMDETSNGGTQLGLASDRPNRMSDYTNRIADINPNDIESVTVLKGPEATALYGSQASSGAVVITTKKARVESGKSINLSYDNSFRLQRVTRLADINNTYGPGTNGVSEFRITPYFGPAYPSDVPEYDNIHKFFKTGFTQTHNLAADFGPKNSVFRVSGSYLKQEGVIPQNEYEKYSLRISNQTKIGKFMDINPSITFTGSTLDKPLRGLGSYLLSLYIWPKDNDVSNYQGPNGNKLALYATDGNTETDNPLFTSLKNRSQDKTNRYVATLGVNIYPTSWLNIAGRFGYDAYTTTGFLFIHPGSNLNGQGRAVGGSLDNYWRKYSGYNHTITATARTTVGSFGLRGMVGTMWQDYQTKQFAIYGTGLKDSSSVDSSNTSPNTRVRLLRNNFGEYNKYITRQMAYFGEVAVSYKNMLFLTYTHRFEASSIFAAENRYYNYPGASLSAIVTDILPGIKGTLNYMKLRTSLAGTARLADPYRNQSVFVNNFASAAGPAYSYGFDNNNPDLKPERQNTYEIGTEMKFFNNRLSIDAAYYNTYCYNQISQGFRNSYATGFVLNTQNAATTRNQGVEISVDVSPVKKKDFDWNIRFNFNHMWSRVIDLPQAIIYEYYIADTWLYGNARGGLVRENSTGTITSFGYSRSNNGDILINPATGLPVIDATFKIHGDRTPKFTLGTNNIIRYKNWNLSFLWDLKVGGDVFNATDMFLTLQGKSQRTADRTTPRVIQGVLNDGYQNTATPTKNTIAILPYYLQTYYTTLPEEEFIQHNVNWLRLRDVTVSYQLPTSALRKIGGLKNLSIFVTGNDLVLFSNYAGADPVSNGNTASSRGVGAFGFDYGNLPTPIGVNFGLRANF